MIESSNIICGYLILRFKFFFWFHSFSYSDQESRPIPEPKDDGESNNPEIMMEEEIKTR